MRSWKTTLSGAVSAGAGFILALSQAGVVLPKWLTVLAAFVMAGGVAGMGIMGKDYNVTGAVAPPSKDNASK